MTRQRPDKSSRPKPKPGPPAYPYCSGGTAALLGALLNFALTKYMVYKMVRAVFRAFALIVHVSNPIPVLNLAPVSSRTRRGTR
jgi:hypothetical protein